MNEDWDGVAPLERGMVVGYGGQRVVFAGGAPTADGSPAVNIVFNDSERTYLRVRENDLTVPDKTPTDWDGIGIPQPVMIVGYNGVRYCFGGEVIEGNNEFWIFQLGNVINYIPVTLGQLAAPPAA